MVANITICNKLKRTDSTTGLDIWYKTILKDIKYKQNKVTTVVGTNVSMGEEYIILLPFSAKYLDYNSWKTNADRDTYYTMSQGDYIFLNTELTEEVSPNNIQKLRTQYSPNVCEVRTIEEIPISSKQYGIKIQLRVSGVK